LTFNFGEAEAACEQRAAHNIATALNVEHHHFDFSGPLREFYGLPQPQFLRMAGPAVTGFPTPVSQSTDVQPFGSTIALMLAASWAVKNGISDVFYAVHGDDARFTDNHPEYFNLLGTVTRECEGEQHAVTFHTPYLGIRKYEVLQKGLDLGVPFELTWSCAIGNDEHCGTCAPCLSRRGAFAVLGITDPVTYTSEFAPSLTSASSSH